jgi:erythromycin esterase-like protein
MSNQRRTPMNLGERDALFAADVARLAEPLDERMDAIVERVAQARHVLIGEASHGTSEYYRCRARLTQRLIAEHGFAFVAVEGDWPDCQAVNAWVGGDDDEHAGEDGDAVGAAEVLRRFDRWPTWMWANEEVVEFIIWLRELNRRTGAGVGFHGLDVYSLWDSLDRIVAYVRNHDSVALDSTMSAMRCFEPYGQDPQRYAAATRLVPDGCEDEVTELLADLRRLTERSAGANQEDFDALQNAEVLAGAERYYRAMMRADANSWNVRDHHMADTFDRLVDHHGRRIGGDARGIVWAHNTHVGDARATDMSDVGMTNIGQLARERYGRGEVALVGFGGFEGTVIAGRRWGSPWEEMTVPPARPESHEALLHRTAEPTFVFTGEQDSPWLATTLPHRAIGVVYRPDGDRHGNWVPTVLGDRYDVFISFGTTHALHPLHVPARPQAEQDTAPWGT